MSTGYSASSSASSGVNAETAFDSSGFSVNFGQQSIIPVWAWVGVIALGLVYLLKRGR